MTREIKAAKKEELPYQQLADEVSVMYPEIKQLYLGQGAGITIDSLKVSPCVIVKVNSDSLMSDSSLEQFKKWIKVRLQVYDVEIYNEVVYQPDYDCFTF